MLAAGDSGRERPTVPFLEQVQGEPGRRRGQALPAKFLPHHLLESRELVGIARERVETPGDAFDAVNEEAEMDARPPLNRIQGIDRPSRVESTERACERTLAARSPSSRPSIPRCGGPGLPSPR